MDYQKNTKPESKRIIVASLIGTIFVGLWVFPNRGVCDTNSATPKAGATYFEVPLEFSAIPEAKVYLEALVKGQQVRTRLLAAKYLPAIKLQVDASADEGNITRALSFQDEQKQVEALIKLTETSLDNQIPRAGSLIDLPFDAPKTLVKLRETWDRELSKIQAELAESFLAKIKALEIKLTKTRDFGGAKIVLALRQNFSADFVVNNAVTEKENIIKSERSRGDHSTNTATKDKPFKNSLGMQFTPVPIAGQKSKKEILFSIWEVRLDDYKVFAKKNKNISWPKVSEWRQGDDHPAVQVNWHDAVAFCEWLTDYEKEKGRLTKNSKYRLPTDFEWSCAAGIGNVKSFKYTPSERNPKFPTYFEWGKEWPPPKGSGNYYGEETKQQPRNGKPPIDGFSDDYTRSAPVGSFSANQFGLYDISGNISEWCNDWYSNAQEKKVVRGGDWSITNGGFLKLSYRGRFPPSLTPLNVGFRCVLEVDK